MPVLADYISRQYAHEKLTIVSPDAGRVRVADAWGERLGAPLAIVHKRRDKDVAPKVSAHEVVGEVCGRVCVLVDDMVDTGGTICAAADALFQQGAEEVIVTATHGVVSGPAGERLAASKVTEFVFTDTLPVPGALGQERVTVRSVAPLIAGAIRTIHQRDSVTRFLAHQ